MLSKEKLNELFEYMDGKLFWKIKPRAKSNIGDRAGTVNSNGYQVIRVNGKNYREHRMVYVMLKGEIPQGAFIDHIDLVRTNNKIENLRIATQQQNNSNVTIKAHNSSGYKGVRRSKSGKSWIAQISINGKCKYMGSYRSPELACNVYAKAAIDSQGEFANII